MFASPEAKAEVEKLIDSLEVGDLVRMNGSLRVIREVTKMRSNRPNRVTSVTLAIMRCSWTRKPFTVRTRCDLYHVDLHVIQRGWGTEHGPLEVILQKDIAARNGKDVILKCCDVIGIVS